MRCSKYKILKLCSFLLFAMSLFSTKLLPAREVIPTEVAREKLLQLFAGEWVSRGLYVVTKLGIPDFLESGPKSSKDLADLSGSHEESLLRILRMLTGFGVFEEIESNTFSNNELSKLLIKNNNNTLYSLCLFYSEDMHKAFNSLSPCIQTGKPAFQIEFQKPVFAFFKDNPERAKLFQKAMKEKSKAVIDTTLSSYDFGKFKTVIDVGGGYGQFIQALTQKYPELNGSVFELKDVTKQLRSLTKEHPRITTLSGDFFKSIPKGHDVYFLKSIIHDWDDQNAEKILKNCYQAMNSDSKLLIVDVVLKPKNESVYASCMDVLMLAITGGKERSLKDFEKLLSQAGFVLENVYSTRTEFSILEARKVDQ